jgi:nicotinate-nucleotide pyrophosphorylase (carboxylating)
LTLDERMEPGHAPGFLHLAAGNMEIDEALKCSIRNNVAAALAEDIGSGDLTAALVPENSNVSASIFARENAVMAGLPWVDEVYRQIDPDIRTDWQHQDGDRVSENDVLCRIDGPARAVLSGERTALNFLQLLSATATVTAGYVASVKGTDAKILDTRKTIPGLRIAQKYAVRCGGGVNHRIGLYDAILIKENHILSAGSIGKAMRAALESNPGAPIEIEVESLGELEEALEAGAKRLLLDNFNLNDLRAAVEINRGKSVPRAELEASGGLQLDQLRQVAETGVDYISVGAITKNVRAIDLSMRFD